MTPDSGEEFYDWRMAEVAEEVRPRHGTEPERRERPEVRLVAAQREKAAALGLLDGHASVVRQLEREKATAETALAQARAENERLRQGKDRFKAGVRAAVTWLHARARTMADPKDEAVLDSAATNLGWDLAAARVQVRQPLTGDHHVLDTDTARTVETRRDGPAPGVPVVRPKDEGRPGAGSRHGR